jgi:hypothetical protein
MMPNYAKEDDFQTMAVRQRQIWQIEHLQPEGLKGNDATARY